MLERTPLEDPGGNPTPVRSHPSLDTPLSRTLGISVPLIGGAMYPCSNPELVAAVSAAGGIGIIQPLSLTYVHGREFVEGVRWIKCQAAGRPVGMNALVERASARYHRQMVSWVDQALTEGIRFFVTSLGNPRWVVDVVHSAGGWVYHDVTERKWAQKAADSGVDGLIAVNRSAGGHPGDRSPAALLAEVGDMGLPVVCAGGVGHGEDFRAMLNLGYDGVQCGTRFIATHECTASKPYKTAILEAAEEDITLTERISGVPVAVIRTPYLEAAGTEVGRFGRWMLKGGRRKRWMRTFYGLRAARALNRSAKDPEGGRPLWQAGRSVGGIRSIMSTAEVVNSFARAVDPNAR